MESPDTKEVFDRVVRWFAIRGGRVVVDAAGENLIRSRRAHETPEFPWIVEIQGWPNLIHELVHVLFAGGLGEDSGFDYAQIPLRPDIAQHRAWLWDELAACFLSCAYANLQELEPCLTGKHPLVRWFEEQVEILPVFYQTPDLPGFVQMVNATMSAYPGEFDAVRTRALADVREVVGGLSPARVSFAQLWSFLEASVAHLD
jgi:hypothetical protein